MHSSTPHTSNLMDGWMLNYDSHDGHNSRKSCDHDSCECRERHNSHDACNSHDIHDCLKRSLISDRRARGTVITLETVMTGLTVMRVMTVSTILTVETEREPFMTV